MTSLPLLALLATPVAAAPSPNPQPPPSKAAPAQERVVIVDLRAAVDSSKPAASDHEVQTQLMQALMRLPDVEVAHAPGSELEQALSGRLRTPIEVEREAAVARLDRAATAFGKLDCVAADEQAGHALSILSGLLAARQAVGEALQEAHVYQLLCAHNRGDSDRAMWVRAKLERLGVTRSPKGVSDLLWNIYPPPDATANGNIVELTITSAPPGADIWLNHQLVGVSPIKVPIGQGTHLLASASGTRHRAVVFDVQRDGQTAHLTLPTTKPPSRYVTLSKRIRSWQGRDIPPTGVDIGNVLRDLDVRFGLILPTQKKPRQSGATPAQNIEIWALGPGDPEARLIGVETVNRIAEIAMSIRERAHRWDQTGPDPNIPLLRESTNGRTGRGTKAQKHKWWVYATIIGAVALGTTVYLANDLAKDRQRIELTWP